VRAEVSTARLNPATAAARQPGRTAFPPITASPFLPHRPQSCPSRPPTGIPARTDPARTGHWPTARSLTFGSKTGWPASAAGRNADAGVQREPAGAGHAPMLALLIACFVAGRHRLQREQLLSGPWTHGDPVRDRVPDQVIERPRATIRLYVRPGHRPRTTPRPRRMSPDSIFRESSRSTAQSTLR
jgi:hypothetical protein